MAKTKLSDLGSSVCVDDQNEKYIPALGNAGGVPGDLCAIAAATGKIAGTQIGTLESFAGILMESKITGTETAPGDGIPCKLVVPKSGHNYRIRCNVVAAAADEVGDGVTFSTTAYKAETTDITIILGFLGRLALEAAVGDTIIEVTWK